MALRAAIVGYMARRLRQLERKTPGSFPPGAVVQANFTLIRRSGIEVAMDAEARRPDALVAGDATLRRNRADGRGRRHSGGGASGQRQQVGPASVGGCRVQLGVRNVQTQIGAGVDVPLRARADGPGRPVVAAARTGRERSCTQGTSAITLHSAKE